MNKEEQEAIEYWKRDIEFYHYNTQLASEHYAQILLNLIDRLQKENEELKKKRNLDNELLKNIVKQEKRFVARDKIKDKIKELDNSINELLDTEDYNKMYAVMVLKSLLEEN